MEFDGVGKRYGRREPWVLHEVDLRVGPGELVRIEGPNGSGKSTLLKLVAGIERADVGTVRVPGRRAYVPERFPPALPFDALTYLRRVGRVHGLSDREAARRASDWLDRFGLADRAGTPISRLSKGSCQKVAVTQALLAEPDVLLLDEAWTGLDQPARALLDQVVAGCAARGARVLFVDHDPNRLAGLTTAAYAVDEGRLRAVEQAPPIGPTVRIETIGPLPDRLPGTPLRKPLTADATLLEVPAHDSDALLRHLLTGTPPVHIHAVTPDADRPAAQFAERSAGEPTTPPIGRRRLPALTRYQLELLLRSHRWLPPFLAYALLLVTGVSVGDEPLGALGYAAAAALPVSAWLVRAAVTGEPAAARACTVAAAGAPRAYLGAPAAALLAALAPAGAGTAGVLAVTAQSKAGPVHTAVAGLLAATVCVLLGGAVGVLCNRPVLVRSQYGIPLALAGATLALAAAGSPANAILRALTAAARTGEIRLPLLALPGALALAAVAATIAAALAARRAD